MIVGGRHNFSDCFVFLMANKSAEAMKQVWNAKRWTPDGIIGGASLYEEVMKPLEKSDCDYPYQGLNGLTYGIRKGELVTVTAGRGIGKSEILREVV